MNIGIALFAWYWLFVRVNSFAVVVTRIFAPEGKLTKISVTVPGSDVLVESDTISATTVRLQLGARYGCLVSILDMVKAAVPALIFKLLYPDTTYYLLAAGAVTVGHLWPVFHGFKGGRGLSCILGGFFVLDWVGTLVTNLIGGVIGIWRKNILLTFGLGITLMIPWIWFRTQDFAQLAYVIFMNVLYWTAMIPEIKEFIKIKESGELDDFQNATEFNVIGADGSERVDTITIPALRKKIASFFGKKGAD